ncbi:CopG family transcriptional regulator [Sphingosinicella sp. BN140058]|uniref:CopG family transcriptional regulator n=1 Tax=Sphingosinicella sp. BN140058 TaxID=1892855 RepID=UPI001011E3BC|nr:CopG family transcriptional regulator [Sphingosinicella sp. BN140058]QAY78173.1 CopG family transcriptional regulator [Sphingosinicella sp. BN140058]
MKVRQNLYIDHELSRALETLAAGSRGNKSHIVNDALKAWLARRGAREVDELLKPRLDRMSREIAGARRDIDVLLESLSLFVRYQLMVTAPLPEADAAARAVGRDRFEAFVAQVGRQIAAGRRTLGPVDPNGGLS